MRGPGEATPRGQGGAGRTSAARPGPAGASGRPEEESVLLAAALDLAGRGWRVAPGHGLSADGRCDCARPGCESPGKHPWVSAWQRQATTDPGTISGWWKRWPDAHPLLATGLASDLVVLDVDPRHGGDETLDALVRTHGALPETTEVLTGGGGRHLFFRHPGPAFRVPNSAGGVRPDGQVKGLGPGLDVRGDGGYVVAPPSGHVSGRHYEWEGSSHPDDVPPAPLPAWLLARVAVPGTPSAPGPGQTRPAAPGAGRAAPGGPGWVDAPVPAGQRNAHLAGLAGTLRRVGAHPGSLLAALRAENEQRCVPPLDDAEVVQIANSVARYTPAVGVAVESSHPAWDAAADVAPDVPPVADGGEAAGGEKATGPAGGRRPRQAVVGVDRPPPAQEGDSPAGEVEETEAGEATPAVVTQASAQKKRGRGGDGGGGGAGGRRRRPPGEGAATPGEGWRQGLTWGRDGPAASVHNVVHVLTHHPAWAGVYRMDEFAQRVAICKRPPYPRRDGEVRDADAAELRCWLGRPDTLGVSVGEEVAVAAIRVVAERHRYNPVMEYLCGLIWDGVPRIERSFYQWWGIPDGEYSRGVAASFFVSAVARVLDPGCQVDTMVIFEGNQGARKTSAIRALFGEDWAAVLTESPANKDFMLGLQGLWAAVVDEMDVFSRAEVSRIKQVVTEKKDWLRPPFGRTFQRYPRQCVFVGTANKDDYLRDPTGGRRFLPVRCGDAVDVDGLLTARDQLWAEAVQLYRAGYQWWDLPAEAVAEQDARYDADVWEPRVMQWLEGQAAADSYPAEWVGKIDKVTVGDVLSYCLRVEVARQDRAAQMRIAGIMRRVGWSRRQVRVGDGSARIWYYVRPGPIATCA